MLEAVRECLQDVFDVPGLVDLMRDIGSRRVTVVDVESSTPSPFAKSLLFGYVAQFLYEGDSPLAERRAAALALDPSLLAELLISNSAYTDHYEWHRRQQPMALPAWLNEFLPQVWGQALRNRIADQHDRPRDARLRLSPRRHRHPPTGARGAEPMTVVNRLAATNFGLTGNASVESRAAEVRKVRPQGMWPKFSASAADVRIT